MGSGQTGSFRISDFACIYGLRGWREFLCSTAANANANADTVADSHPISDSDGGHAARHLQHNGDRDQLKFSNRACERAGDVGSEIRADSLAARF
jgi:hypothetical protein